MSPLTAALLSCTTTSRPVLVANQSIAPLPEVEVLSGGRAVARSDRLDPGQVLLAEVPEGSVTLVVLGHRVPLPDRGGALAVLAPEAQEWLVGPLGPDEISPVDPDALPWGSQLAEALSTGTFPAERVSGLTFHPWSGPGDRPGRRAELTQGVEVDDAEQIASFLDALKEAHYQRPTGTVEGAPRVVVVARVQPDMETWFVLSLAPTGTVVHTPLLVDEVGDHRRTVGAIPTEKLPVKVQWLVPTP